MALFDRGHDGEPSISAETMVDELLAGKSVKAHQHFVVYDQDNELVWYTNPYGIDGIFCERPTVEQMRRFLNDLDAGRCFGLFPYPE
ncbi:hypothetical protein BSFA1_86180 (plasmid) [Burkholderia sp. SFA1]|nr:hypothetical protein BSFA1_86180 [Burkholderia sp. SFA1]